MNEIEKALNYFKNLSAQQDRDIKNTGDSRVIELLKISKSMFDLAAQALQEKAERDNPQPLSLEQFEKICEEVHNGWWNEKIRQGVTDHPDMIPYEKLAESIKEYDRVTVSRVLDAIGILYKPKEV